VTLHIDIPTRSEVEQLLTAKGAPCVSVYVATSPLPAEAQAARIELRNLGADAIKQLEAIEVDRGIIPQLREALEELGGDEDFWAEQAWSLAVFASPGSLRTFRLPNRLGSHVEVGDRFYVKPLLRALTFPQAAFVLALAAGSVRLIEVLPDGPAYTVDVPELPMGAASAAGKASIGDRSPSARSRAARVRRSGCGSTRGRSTRRCAACSVVSSCR
jgi:Bacterial archaeo-eukaryotic release factor family 11